MGRCDAVMWFSTAWWITAVTSGLMKFRGKSPTCNLHPPWRGWQFYYFYSGISIDTIVSQVTWLPTPQRGTLLQCTIFGHLAGGDRCDRLWWGATCWKVVQWWWNRTTWCKITWILPFSAALLCWRLLTQLVAKVSVWGSKSCLTCCYFLTDRLAACIDSVWLPWPRANEIISPAGMSFLPLVIMTAAGRPALYRHQDPFSHNPGVVRDSSTRELLHLQGWWKMWKWQYTINETDTTDWPDFYRNSFVFVSNFYFLEPLSGIVRLL